MFGFIFFISLAAAAMTFFMLPLSVKYKIIMSSINIVLISVAAYLYWLYSDPDQGSEFRQLYIPLIVYTVFFIINLLLLIGSIIFKIKSNKTVCS